MTGNSPPRKSTKKVPRLTRNEWLNRALGVIGREGKGWIGIHDLVELVGVTKGSFYWHFEGRADFVTALLAHWVDISTSQIAEELDESGKSAEEKLLELAQEIVARKLDRFNLAISAWALREPAVAAAVRKVERFRWNYVESLFREIGFRGPELEMRTRTFVVYYTYEASLAISTDRAKQLQAVELRHAMLVGKESKDGHE